MKVTNILSLLLLVFMISCNPDDTPYDASGVFETNEVIVSAEVNGKIIELDIEEGEEVLFDERIGLIDTVQLHLKRKQLEASRQAILSGRPNVQSQIEATEQEIMKWEKEQARVEKLLAGDVATQKQLDDIISQLAILESRLNAQKSSLYTNVSSIESHSMTVDVQIEQVVDMLERSVIKSPITGKVLVKYAETGEVTGAGKPLVKLGDMSNMVLRAYVTTDQLTSLQVGQRVSVLAEFGQAELREYEGQVAWISSQSEFTPKTIQTQDERANLVYAVKVTVKNDGYLKIGMYGGIKLEANEAN